VYQPASIETTSPKAQRARSDHLHPRNAGQGRFRGTWTGLSLVEGKGRVQPLTSRVQADKAGEQQLADALDKLEPASATAAVTCHACQPTNTRHGKIELAVWSNKKARAGRGALTLPLWTHQ
jgi:hypothetical protein